MKKHLRFVVVIAALIALIGCSKQDASDKDVADIWNGYESYKYSTMTVDIVMKTRGWGGWKCHSRYRKVVIGSAEYVFTDDARFEVTYTLNDGWELLKTYMYAGDYDALPTGRWNHPRIWQFPNITTHDPTVSEFTYSIPVVDLPPGQTGFVVAASTKVKKNCREKRAWAEGDRRFSGKGWGMYTSNYFQEAMDIIVLYGIEQSTDGNLRVQHINASSGDSELILEEEVNASGSVEGVAYDPASGLLYFAVGNSLYGNDLNSDTVSEFIGDISGIAGGATFMNDSYYYYNADPISEDFAKIMEVDITFDTINGWTALENPNYGYSLMDDIDFDINITDMASSGSTMYMVGTDHNQTPENLEDDLYWLVTWDGGNYSLSPAEIVSDAQIAFGADDQMYVIQYDANGDAYLQTMDPGTGDTSPDDPTQGEQVTRGDGGGDLKEITGGIMR